MRLLRLARRRSARASVCSLLVVVTALLAAPVSASGQGVDRVAVDVEGAGLWLARNDVRIPNTDAATRFSLVDVVGRGTYGAVRLGADVNFNERHGLRVVFAPLRVDDVGTLTVPVSFAGQAFAAGPIDASYQFSSYRATYRYRVFSGDRWQWRVGFTGFVRDARVALESNGQLAEDTDVGFVPLLHLQGQARLTPRVNFQLELDGLAAPQGRAFDVSAKLAYEIADHWHAGFGYRTIEGGADVDQVFNFAWLNFAVASIRYKF